MYSKERAFFSFFSFFSFLVCVSLLPAALPKTVQAGENTYTVAYGNVTVEKESKASLIYPAKTVIRYEGQTAAYVSSSVKHGQSVEAGDLIMTVAPEINPVDIEEKERELDRLKTNLEDEIQLKNSVLSALRNRRDSVWWNYWEYQKSDLEIQKEELDLEYETALRKREISRKEKELKKLRDALNAVEIRTPVSGIVTNLIVPEEGAVIQNDMLICFIEDPSFLRIKSASCPFPFGSQVQITGSLKGEPLKADAVITGSSSVENIDTNQFRSYITPTDPELSFESIQNLSISGTVCELKNVLLVPTKAVHSDSEGDFVYLLTDSGSRLKQYIKTRIVNSDWTWVICGLSEGQTVTFR